MPAPPAIIPALVFRLGVRWRLEKGDRDGGRTEKDGALIRIIPTQKSMFN
jgi:hypothetical protein